MKNYSLNALTETYTVQTLIKTSCEMSEITKQDNYCAFMDVLLWMTKSYSYRPGETGQHYLPDLIVSVVNQALPFCPWLMIKKQTMMFAKQCWPVSARLTYMISQKINIFRMFFLKN